MNDCPLPPTSDQPFSLPELQAWLVDARQVLASWDTVPLEARRTTFLDGETPTWVASGTLAATLETRASRANEASRLFHERRTRGGLTGEVLRQERAAAGLGQREVARLVGISRSGLQAIETGDRRSTPALRQLLLDTILEAGAAGLPSRPCLGCEARIPGRARTRQVFCTRQCQELEASRRKRRGRRVEAGLRHAEKWVAA